MTEPEPLTETDVDRLLQQLNCTDTEGGPPRCPVCKTAVLTITANGDGPHLECANGCVAIASYLQTVKSLPIPKGPHVNKVAVLRDKLALPELAKVVKHGRLGDNYELHLADDRVVSLGSIATILQQARFRAAYLPQVRRQPPRYKPADWDQIAELIEQAAEEHETADQAEETAGWLVSYLRNANVKRGIDLDDSAALYALLDTDCDVFVDTRGCLHLRLAAFTQWVTRMIGVRCTVPEVAGRLSALRFQRTRHAARRGEDTTKGRYWTSPPHVEDTLR